MKPQLDYATFTARSIGFLTADEQARLCQLCVFVCGAGGMNGAPLLICYAPGSCGRTRGRKPERSDIGQTLGCYHPEG
jgi:hypothetical protein